MKRAAAAGVILFLVFLSGAMMTEKTKEAAEELSALSQRFCLEADTDDAKPLLDELNERWRDQRELFLFFASRSFVSRTEELLGRIRTAAERGDSSAAALDSIQLSEYFKSITM